MKPQTNIGKKAKIKIHLNLLFWVTLLAVGLIGYNSSWPSTLHAQSFDNIRVHRIGHHTNGPRVGYPHSYKPAIVGDQMGDLYVQLEMWPYSNGSPSYYGSNAKETPFFVYTLIRDGQTIATCRRDYPIFDECIGSALTHNDRNVQRGSYYTYSGFIQTYERDPRCENNYPDLTYCGPEGNAKLLGTGPTFTTAPVYIGTQNRPGMSLKASYEGRDISGNTIKIPRGDAVTVSWGHISGDAPTECAVYKDGSQIETSRGSGSTSFNVGSVTGSYRVSLKCINGYHPPGTPVSEGITKILTYEVVDQLPEGYYDNTDPTGGGGTAIALPIDPIPEEGNDTTNVFSDTSGSFVSMKVTGCSTDTAGFTTSASDREGDTYTYPFGVMSFTLRCSRDGSTARITKHYYTEADPTNAVLRKYNSQSNEYTNISNASIQSVTHNGRKALEVSYSVTDGGPLDEDGEANSIIVDPVALGIVNPDAVQTRVETDCNSENLTPENCGILLYVRIFTDALTVLVGIVVVIMIILGGIQYSAAGNNPQIVAAAKKKITNALIALVLFLFMAAFLQWIVPGGVL